MLAGFWTGVGGKLAERLVATILTPAFAFWAGGLLAWVDREGWASVENWIADRSSGVQAALAIGSILLIAVSGLVVEHLTLPVLRFLEGYWPRWLDWARRPLVDRKRKQRYFYTAKINGAINQNNQFQISAFGNPNTRQYTLEHSSPLIRNPDQTRWQVDE